MTCNPAVFELLNDDHASAASRILPFLFSSEVHPHHAAFLAPASKLAAVLAVLSELRRLAEQLRKEENLISSKVAPLFAIFREFRLVFLFLVHQLSVQELVQVQLAVVGEHVTVVVQQRHAVEQVVEELEERLAELEFLARPNLKSETTAFQKLSHIFARLKLSRFAAVVFL